MWTQIRRGRQQLSMRLNLLCHLFFIFVGPLLESPLILILILSLPFGRPGRQGAAAGPAPTTVPVQLFDDTPAAAELLMPLKGRRVGVYWRLFEDAQPEVVAACRHALGLLEEHGCEVRGSLAPDAPKGACMACWLSVRTSQKPQMGIGRDQPR